MTFEHRLLVGFEEIKAVVFECNICKSRTSIPSEKLERIPVKCPNNHAWILNKPVLDNIAAFDAFVLLLHGLRDPMADVSNQAGFRILLEFESPKHSAE